MKLGSLKQLRLVELDVPWTLLIHGNSSQTVVVTNMLSTLQFKLNEPRESANSAIVYCNIGLTKCFFVRADACTV